MKDAVDGLIGEIRDIGQRRETAKQKILEDDNEIVDLTRNLEAAKARKLTRVKELATLDTRLKVVGSRLSFGVVGNTDQTRTPGGSSPGADADHEVDVAHSDAPAGSPVGEGATRTRPAPTPASSISARNVEMLRTSRQAKDHRTVSSSAGAAVNGESPSSAQAQAIGATSPGNASPAGEFEPLHAKFPIVINYQGRWVELTCRHCGCNASPNQRCYFSVPKGFALHYRLLHKLPCAGLGLATYCNMRDLSSQDVELIRSGAQARDHPITRIAQFPEPNNRAATHVQRGRAVVPTDLRPIHGAFPTMVMYKHAWVEMTCRYCESNVARTYAGGYMAGANGLHKHVMKAHGRSVPHQPLEGYCKVRRISDRDRDLLLLGNNALDRPIVPLRQKMSETAEQREALGHAGEKRKHGSQVTSPPGIGGDTEADRAAKRRIIDASKSVNEHNGEPEEIKREEDAEVLSSDDE